MGENALWPQGDGPPGGVYNNNAYISLRKRHGPMIRPTKSRRPMLGLYLESSSGFRVGGLLGLLFVYL